MSENNGQNGNGHPRQNDGEVTQKSEGKRPTHDANGKFVKGNCANPGGRPKGKTLWTRMREKLMERDGEDADAIAAAWIAAAKKGSAVHLFAIVDRQSGKVKDHLEVKSETTTTITVGNLMKDPAAQELAEKLANRLDPTHPESVN